MEGRCPAGSLLCWAAHTPFLLSYLWHLSHFVVNQCSKRGSKEPTLPKKETCLLWVELPESAPHRANELWDHMAWAAGGKKMILWYLCNVFTSAEFGVVFNLGPYSTPLFQISPIRYKSSVFMPIERRKKSPNLPTIWKFLKSNYKGIHAVVSGIQRRPRLLSNVFFSTAHRFSFFLCEPLLLELSFSGPVHSVFYG